MENSALEARVAKLEKQSASRFFVQYLLSPLLVLAVGAVMNYRVEQNRGEIERAKSDIQRIEDAYNSYHQVFELSKLLRSRRQELNDENKRREIFQLIVDRYSYGAPPDLFNQLKIMAKQ